MLSFGALFLRRDVFFFFFFFLSPLCVCFCVERAELSCICDLRIPRSACPSTPFFVAAQFGDCVLERCLNLRLMLHVLSASGINVRDTFFSFFPTASNWRELAPTGAGRTRSGIEITLEHD